MFTRFEFLVHKCHYFAQCKWSSRTVNHYSSVLSVFKSCNWSENPWQEPFAYQHISNSTLLLGVRGSWI